MSDLELQSWLYSTYHTPTKWTCTSLAKVDLNSFANFLDSDLGGCVTSWTVASELDVLSCLIKTDIHVMSRCAEIIISGLAYIFDICVELVGAGKTWALYCSRIPQAYDLQRNLSLVSPKDQSHLIFKQDRTSRSLQTEPRTLTLWIIAERQRTWYAPRENPRVNGISASSEVVIVS